MWAALGTLIQSLLGWSRVAALSRENAELQGIIENLRTQNAQLSKALEIRSKPAADLRTLADELAPGRGALRPWVIARR